MASIGRDPNGGKRILFVDDDGTRRTIRLGKMSIKLAETVKHHVETMLACRRAGVPLPAATATWLGSIDNVLHERLAKAGLVPRRQNETLGKFLADWLQSRSHYKATSRDAWSRSINDLIGFFGSETPLRKIGHDEAQAFRRHLIDRGLRDTTIHKRLQHVKLFFRDAVRRDGWTPIHSSMSRIARDARKNAVFTFRQRPWRKSSANAPTRLGGCC